MCVPPATLQRILPHSSIFVTTNTYVEVIEAVQRDALDAMGNLFTHPGGGPIGEPLSPRSLPLSSKLSSNASNEVTQNAIDPGGAKGIRTPDPHTASVVRYQLRHSPKKLCQSKLHHWQLSFKTAVQASSTSA